jgi:hypothetical protein
MYKELRIIILLLLRAAAAAAAVRQLATSSVGRAQWAARRFDALRAQHAAAGARVHFRFARLPAPPPDALASASVA